MAATARSSTATATPSSGFYYCRLTSVSGADIINGAKNYQVQNAVVEPDGSWIFNEQVENSGGTSFYEWHVATSGAVNGAYQFNGGPIEAIGGLPVHPHAERLQLLSRPARGGLRP